MRALLLAALGACAAFAQPLPVSTPEKEGFSSERLERLHRHFDSLTSSGERPGAITMVVRGGRIVDWRAYGLRDVENRLPMERDTIVHIYSMTKTVTSVAVMMLVEEGRLSLDDRVEKYIPEFKGLKVYKGGTVERPELEELARPITVKHLLTHTSGLTYGWGNDNVSALYRKVDPLGARSLKEFIERLSRLPLAFQPGERYEYSVSIDVLGYLVEVVSGEPFDQFVEKRITGPLKMPDTHFRLPEAKRPRLARIYSRREGKLVPQPGLQTGGVPYGGMGLYSTIGDYARFAQMLLNGGQLDGVRLLGRKTVDLMMMNHLAGLPRPTIGGDDADGFGLGGAVRIDVARSGRPASEGLFGWNGAASTFFRIDRREKLALLVFMQWMPFDAATLNLFETLVYQALVD
ncbi:MAG: serine hydrolase domain-containing protein [Bryobacteraceae bacterium]